MKKMKSKVGMGASVIVLAVLATMLTTVPSALAQPQYSADSVYFVPEQSNEVYCQNNTYVEVRLNTSFVTYGPQVDIAYDSNCVSITAVNFTGTAWPGLNKGWSRPTTNSVRIAVDVSQGASGDHLMATMTLHCINSTGKCTSYLNFTDASIIDYWGDPQPVEIYNGTFTCGAVETFNKDLYEGWNLVSLPLTPEDSSTNAVLASLTGNYEAVYKYDTNSHGFVLADTMVPGTGYFVNMTADDTWTYEGSAYTSMAVSQEQGLNMVGWLNCTQESISAALSSIEGSYRYVARWNTSLQNYEVYVPGAPEIFHEFSVLTRGEGYFIAAKQSGTLEASCPG